MPRLKVETYENNTLQLRVGLTKERGFKLRLVALVRHLGTALAGGLVWTLTSSLAFFGPQNEPWL